MSIDPVVTERWIRAQLELTADPASAASQRAYMKSDLEFVGVSQAEVRRVARALAAEHRELDRADLRALARHAFAGPSWDLRSVAIALLERKAKLLVAADLVWIVELVRIAHAWAHVDWLATKVVPFALRDADLGATLRTWARDPDVWVRRTALLAQHDALKHGEGDWDLFVEIAVPMLGEKEFWIRKALGWVLREVGKKRPALVRAFLAEHGDRCSGLTRREAEKPLRG